MWKMGGLWKKQICVEGGWAVEETHQVWKVGGCGRNISGVDGGRIMEETHQCEG